MKTIIAALIAVSSCGAFAATSWSGSCVEGNEYRLPNEGRPGDGPGTVVVCKGGELVKKPVTITKCKAGKRAYFPVKGVYQGREELQAAATCINGKWIFDNDAYNYVPTKGLNKCKEGTIEYAQKFGPNGNPSAKDLICKNGKMVELN